MAVKEKVIFTDGRELILLLPGRAGRESYMFQAEDVRGVRFMKASNLIEKIMGKSHKKIAVSLKNLGDVEFDGIKHKKFFDGYMVELREFCKKNYITFQDLTEEKQ